MSLHACSTANGSSISKRSRKSAWPMRRSMPAGGCTSRWPTPDDETPEQRSLEVSSEQWGFAGQGRCRTPTRRRLGGHRTQTRAMPPRRRTASLSLAQRSHPGRRLCRPCLEEALSEPVPQARVRYHADGVTAFVDVDEAARRDLAAAIERARASPQHRTAAGGRKRKPLPAMLARAGLPAGRGADGPPGRHGSA